MKTKRNKDKDKKDKWIGCEIFSEINEQREKRVRRCETFLEREEKGEGKIERPVQEEREKD